MSSVDSRAARLLSSQGQAEWDPISGEYYAPASGLGNAGLAGLGALRGPMVFPTLPLLQPSALPEVGYSGPGRLWQAKSTIHTGPAGY